MSCNSYKYSDTCGQSIYATCVNVEHDFIAPSSLAGETCTDLDAAITDIYALINKTYVDMAGDISGATGGPYVKGCLDYSPTADADITPIQVLNKLTEEVCTLQPLEGLLETDGTLKPIPEFDISNLNLNCLVPDPCGATPTTLEELLQTIINKLCVCCP
tara:strand:+ start:4064 stop:4543 length:480 start_codon:yes stop_codon:yes gene_type:complete